MIFKGAEISQHVTGKVTNHVTGKGALGLACHKKGRSIPFWGCNEHFLVTWCSFSGFEKRLQKTYFQNLKTYAQTAEGRLGVYTKLMSREGVS